MSHTPIPEAATQQWAWLEHAARVGQVEAQCILQLRARVEALEAAQQQPPAVKESLTVQPPAGLSLIDELAMAIGDELDLPHLDWRPEARRALAVIVRRLREHGSPTIADWLEQEAAQQQPTPAPAPAKSAMTTYTSRTTEITVFPEKEGILSEGAVAIRLIDEGGGEFLELSQDGEHVRLDPEELPLIYAEGMRLLGQSLPEASELIGPAS